MGVLLMEKEQEKCELCESIKQVNAIAAEELRKISEAFVLDLKTDRKHLFDDIKLLYSDILGTSLKDNKSFGVAFRTCFEGASFVFISDNHVTIKNIQYCPYCGRKIT